jgi:hypothetical protein
MPVLRFIAIGIAKTMSKVFGLATMAFFGRMPTKDNDRIAAVGVLSLTWLVVLAAVIFPPLAELLIPFLPDDETVLRVTAVTLAILIPLTNALIIRSLHNQAEGSARRGLVWLHAWWYTAWIGLVVSSIVVTVPLIRTSQIVKRFSVARMLVMIPMHEYDDAVDHIRDCLEQEGVDTEIVETNSVLRWMFAALTYTLGHIFCRDVATQLCLLRGEDPEGEGFEIHIHSADLTILAKKQTARWIKAILADSLDERKLYFTWDDDSQQIEDRISELRDDLESGEYVDPDELTELAQQLARLALDQEEWGNVRRNLYRLERDSRPEPDVDDADRPSDQRRSLPASGS